MLYLNLRVNIATRSICRALTMTEATLTADFNKFTDIFDAQRSIDSQYTRRINIESYDF
jgi:hypothetical protein